jgi:hypothetical protein
MVAARNLYLDFCLMAITNEQLKLGMRNFMWGYVINIQVFLWSLLHMLEITNVETV